MDRVRLVLGTELCAKNIILFRTIQDQLTVNLLIHSQKKKSVPELNDQLTYKLLDHWQYQYSDVILELLTGA